MWSLAVILLHKLITTSCPSYFLCWYKVMGTIKWWYIITPSRLMDESLMVCRSEIFELWRCFREITARARTWLPIWPYVRAGISRGKQSRENTAGIAGRFWTLSPRQKMYIRLCSTSRDWFSMVRDQYNLQYITAVNLTRQKIKKKGKYSISLFRMVIDLPAQPPSPRPRCSLKPLGRFRSCNQ